MPQDLQSFYRAALAYAAVRRAEAELASLTRQLQELESTVEASRKIVSAFIEEQPSGQRMLDEHLAFLRRAGLVEDQKSRSNRRSRSQSLDNAGPRRPRTAAATEAAAARRRAYREQNPDKGKVERPIDRRLKLFDEGFVHGYRDRVESHGATNRYVKGDRSRGWIIGAETAAADLAAGVVAAGAADVAVPATPPQARDDFAAGLRVKGASETRTQAAM